MTKKKRQRKEQHHQHGNPPPPTPIDPWDRSISPPPDNLRILDETEGDDVWDGLDDLDDDLLAEGDPFGAAPPLTTEQELRPVERNLMRMRSYLERKGIVVTPENEKEVADLLAEGEWQREPEVLNTSLDRAQALIYDAFELPATMSNERIRLARQALTTSRNCADAHTLLAEEEASTDEIALRHYTDAIKAAERALQDVDLTARPGDFWYLMKLRPLLRALAGAADLSLVLNEPERALGLYRRLYAIDALDLMEVREAYVGLLTEFALNDELIEFLHRQGRLKTIEDESIHVEFSMVLAFFRMLGDSGTARLALEAAAERHPRMVGYLLGAERITANDLLSLDAADEGVQAVQYFVRDIWLWLSTPNAIEWVRANAGARVA